MRLPCLLIDHVLKLKDEIRIIVGYFYLKVCLSKLVLDLAYFLILEWQVKEYTCSQRVVTICIHDNNIVKHEFAAIQILLLVFCSDGLLHPGSLIFFFFMCWFMLDELMCGSQISCGFL